MRRWLMAGVLMAFPLVGVLSFMGTANAASSAACTKLTGKVNLTTGFAKVTISGCNDTANTGGGATTQESETGTTGTLTWKGGKGTTTLGSITTTTVSPDKCPGSDIEEETVASVTGGTGAAVKSIKPGWTAKSFVCYDPSNNDLTLLKGTKYEMGTKY
jgi:hypothetical protein